MLEVVNGEEVTMKTRVSLTSFVCTDFSAPNSPFLVVRMSPFLLVQGKYFSHGSLMICFSEKGLRGCQNDFPDSAAFSNFFSLRYLICQGAVFADSVS